MQCALRREPHRLEQLAHAPDGPPPNQGLQANGPSSLTPSTTRLPRNRGFAELNEHHRGYGAVVHHEPQDSLGGHGGRFALLRRIFV
jgi:hypothetical protein